MQYNQPYGNADPNASYVNGNPATGTAGSIIPAAAIEYTQREIIAVIQAAGLAPSNGNLAQLLAAIQALGGNFLPPTRIVTSSATLNLDCVTDANILLNRTAAVTAMTVNLAASGSLVVGKTYRISDVAKNFDTAKVTIVPPATHNIAGNTNFIMDKQQQSASFVYGGSSTWDVQSS
ncbi:MAG TPA: hypothetical protein VKW08_07740 [Xanthobacteraceae bacterium]|nr:hypothetical protein [Xanthobacteraceae bacterium]